MKGLFYISFRKIDMFYTIPVYQKDRLISLTIPVYQEDRLNQKSLLIKGRQILL